MKINLSLISVLLFISTAAMAEEPMQCDIGPIKKVYGNSNWLVYSCIDNKSLVIVTDQGNPAMPFYFMYYPKDGGYTLRGEGTGNKIYTKAAYKQMENIPLKDIKKLIKETVAISKK